LKTFSFFEKKKKSYIGDALSHFPHYSNNSCLVRCVYWYG